MNYNQLTPLNNQGQQEVGTVMHNQQHRNLGYGQINANDEDDNAFDPVKILFYCLKYRWLIAAFVLASIVCAVIFTFLQTPRYSASTKVEIVTSGARVFQDLEVVSQSTDFRVFETAKQKMLSRELAQRVVFELDLANDPKFLAPAPTFSLTNLFRRIAGSDNKADLSEINDEDRQRLATNLVKDNTSVSLIRNTSILSVGYTHPSPEIVTTIANQIARSYIEQNVDKKGETSELARQFIVEQVQETKTKLQKSERELVAYAQREGITVTGDDVSLVSSNISEINKALTDSVQERLAAERLAQQVTNGDSNSLPDVFESRSIQENKLRIADLSSQYQQKLSTLKPGFPEMVRLRAQINELRKQINSEVSAIARSVALEFEQAKIKEATLRSELRKLEGEQAEFQKKNIQYTIFKREVDSNRKQYENLIDKLNEVGVGSELKSSNASIVDPAFMPTSPYSPKLSINLLGFLGGFLILAGGIIYLIEFMNNTFTVPDQIEEELKLSVLGIIPLVSDPQDSEPTSAVSEAYRTLRTSVQFTGSDKTLKTIMVTSSEPSEAKTTTVYKLAEGYAALGKHVLVIDSDLRKPRMHKVMDMENGMGLSNLLTNVVREDKVVDIFRRTSNPNISFLSAGTIPPNPTDLLMSNKMGLTLHFCAKKYDLVIVDAPPVMGLSDAPILSRLVDATLFVVSFKQVPRKSAKNAIARLRAVGANIVGVAFTRFDTQKIGYEYGYKYMQNNYYSYGLDETEKQLISSNVGDTQIDSSNQKPDAGNSVSNFVNRLMRRFS